MSEEDLFQEALQDGDVEGVREYSRKYPNITFEGLTPIHISCCYGHIDVVKLLIEQGCNIECEDSEKGRPIHLACSEGHTDIVRLLIEKGCNIECEDSNKSRPIHSACSEGHIETVRFLIEQHCDIECEDLDKGRPINYACLEGHTEIVRLLIENGCNIECEDPEESRPIHYACSKGHTDAVRLLIEHGCNIECEDVDKGKPIYYACKNGHIETVRLLIEKGCDIECEDVDNRKPIHIACIFGHTETVRLLIEKGCDIECEDADKKRPIHLAVAKDHIDIIRLLIEKGCNIECEDLFKMRPIHYACFNGQTDIVFLLLDKGCDFECEDLDKMRPIHLAGLKGHTDTIRLLIENGCNINCEDSVKKRPIHDACANGHFDAVKLLKEKGCDTACEDSNERTPIFLACIFGHNKIVDLLRGENENNRDAIADQMALTCGPSCDHNGFCRESFMKGSSDMKGDLIGEGAFGAVYRLTESATGRRFALKYIKKNDDPNKLKNIETYINICLKSVKHENIVEYFGSNTESSSNDVYIFMEYVEGGSLLEYMKNKKGLPHDKVLWFTKQILKGISFLHRLRIVHRDIKPANILLDDKENVKLSDFGLSRFLQHSDKFIEDPSGPLELLKEEYRKNPVSENLDKIEKMISSYYEFEPVKNYVEDITTETCASGLGTPGYTAPEIRKNKSYGLAVDVWSVGTTMFHLLTGNLPHAFKNFFEIKKKGFVYDLMNVMCKQNPSDRPTAISLLKKIEDNETLLQ